MPFHSTKSAEDSVRRIGVSICLLTIAGRKVSGGSETRRQVEQPAKSPAPQSARHPAASCLRAARRARARTIIGDHPAARAIALRSHGSKKKV